MQKRITRRRDGDQLQRGGVNLEMYSLHWMWRFLVAPALGLVLAACGLDEEGEVSLGADAAATDTAQSRPDAGPPDTSSGHDATIHEGGAKLDSSEHDAPKSDAGSPMDSGTDSSHSTPDASSDAGGLTYTCASGPTDDCSTCTGNVVGCAWCSSTGVVGFCIPQGQLCLGYAPTGSKPCPCTVGDPTECVAADQGCLNTLLGQVCVTCGEAISNGETCKGGGTCNASTPTCM
jgi:hypothetical protein